MKHCFYLFLCSFFLVAAGGWGQPAYAQKQLDKILQKLSSLEEKSVRSSWGRWLVKPSTTLIKASVAGLSRHRALAAVSPLFSQELPSTGPRPLLPAPTTIRKGVFTLQETPKTHGKGSAFAVMIDGTAWGVTARHVLDDIGRSPVLSVTDEQGKEKFFQVYSLREGNVHGADIALFRIPQEALAYIHPFEPDYTLPKAHSSIQSAGFSHGFFSWFPKIDVLFASDHRILTNYQDYPIRNGYCGSPLLRNGKVIGVFTGVVTPETAQKSAWYPMISPTGSITISPFNHAVPVEWVRILVRQQPSSGGITLRFAGETLGLLHPDENIHSIQQLREDRLHKTFSAYPFMDYAHLERFFEIEPGDIFRIIIHKGDRSSSKRSRYWYEWNSQTHTVTRTEAK